MAWHERPRRNRRQRRAIARPRQFEFRRPACLKVFDKEIVIALRQRDRCGPALCFVPASVINQQLPVDVNRRTIVRVDREGIGAAAKNDELTRPRHAEVFGHRVAPGASKIVGRRLRLDRGENWRGTPIDVGEVCGVEAFAYGIQPRECRNANQNRRDDEQEAAQTQAFYFFPVSFCRGPHQS